MNIVSSKGPDFRLTPKTGVAGSIKPLEAFSCFSNQKVLQRLLRSRMEQHTAYDRELFVSCARVQFKTCDMWSKMENLMEPAAEVQAHIFHAVQTEGIELSNEVWKLRSSASGWICLNRSCKVTHVILKSQTDICSLRNYIVYLHMYIIYIYIFIYIYAYMQLLYHVCTSSIQSFRESFHVLVSDI